MQNWGFSKTVFRLMAIVGVLAGMLTILGCPGGEEERKVAAADTVISSPTALKKTLPAIEGTTFSLPAGAFAGTSAATALGNQATTVKFTNTTAATPTATITDASGKTATATTTFGSCTFTVAAQPPPTISGVTVGQEIKVDPCEINIKTGGVEATGQATAVDVILKLGLIPSRPQQIQVAINPDTGVVTVNNIDTGQSVTLVLSGGAGG